MTSGARSSLLALLATLLVPAVLAAAQSPYLGAPFQLPTTIQAENYDLGGEGVAYHDTSAGNVFGVYRTDGVDVGAIPAGSGGGYFVGYLEAGEWVEYTINVPTTKAYDVTLRLASANVGPNNFHLEVDGINVSGTRAAPNTGDWQTYTTLSVPSISLTAGSNRVLRISFDTGYWNLDWLDIQTAVGPVLTITRTDGAYRPPYTSLGNLNHIQLGTASRTTTYTLTNSGSASLTLQSAAIPSATWMSITSPPAFPYTLAPGASTTLSVKLQPPPKPAPGDPPAPVSEFKTLQIQTAQLGLRTISLFAYFTTGRYCDPGPMAEDFTRVLDGLESASTGCWSDSYLYFAWGGSQNIPVITSAVRLFALNESSAANFFLNYVNKALGVASNAPANFRNFMLDELGSPNYDPITVTGILGARAWAHKQNDTALETATGQWLRAYFTLAALATGPGPGSSVPVAAFVDNGLTYYPYPNNFRGPAVILAGQRSCPEDWGFTNRPRMVALALGLGGNGQGAAAYEAIWTRLQTVWNLPPALSTNLYGMLASETQQLRNLINGVSCPMMVTTALQGIWTKARLDSAGWTNASGWGLVRASTSGAVNQVNLFGTALVTASRNSFPANSVYVVYPFADPSPDPMFPNDPLKWKYPTCAGAGTGGTVQMVLTGDKKISYTGTPNIVVDLPDTAQNYTFAIGPTGLIVFSCPP